MLAVLQARAMELQSQAFGAAALLMAICSTKSHLSPLSGIFRQVSRKKSSCTLACLLLTLEFTAYKVSRLAAPDALSPKQKS